MGDKHGALFSGAPEYVKVSRVYKVSSVLFVKADTHTHTQRKEAESHQRLYMAAL